MNRLIFVWISLLLFGLNGKVQAQKTEKVDGMLYRIIKPSEIRTGEFVIVGKTITGFKEYEKPVQVTGEVALIGGNIKTMEYTVPSHVTIDGKEYTVTELRNQKEGKAVYSLKSEQFGKVVRKLILPNTIKEIGFGTFHYHPNLEEVVLPLSLDKIGYNAFWHCTSLRRLEGLNSGILFGKLTGGWVSLEELIESKNAYEDFGTFSTCVSLPPLEKIMGAFSYHALGKIKTGLKEWQQKKEFETTAQWQQRVTVANREKRVQQLLEEAKQEYIATHSNTKLQMTVGNYDADYNIYPIDIKSFGKVYVQVPLADAPAFKENFSRAQVTPKFGIQDDHIAVVGMEVAWNGKNYHSMAPVEEDNRQLLAQLPPLDINLDGESTPAQQDAASAPQPKTADVDTNIPTINTVADKTFAIVIANEEYTREAQVPFALRDGEVFAEYCKKTLGIPERNIRVVKNATLNDMKFQLDWLRQVLATYNGEAKAIVYYAGHGIPDEADKGAYLLPVDGYGSNVATGFALKDFYATLSSAPAESVTVFLDACFSGAKRESGMMASARGVAIKVREEAPQGNMVVFTAAQGDETAYQYAEKGHGMFTYFLLKKLQASKGNVTLGELGDYLVNEVKRESLLNNNKAQTPTVIPAPGITSWRERKLQ